MLPPLNIRLPKGESIKLGPKPGGGGGAEKYGQDCEANNIERFRDFKPWSLWRVDGAEDGVKPHVLHANEKRFARSAHCRGEQDRSL